MIVKYTDGTEETIKGDDIEPSESFENFLKVIKRKYDTNGDYEESDDEVVAFLNLEFIRSIKL